MCVCTLGGVVWCCVPACLCFFPEHGNAAQWAPVCAGCQRGFGTVSGALAASISRGAGLLLLCTSDRAEWGEYQKQKLWNGHRFSNQSVIHAH